jgi:phenylacetate-coenzyme A ligase PaaK-like adenylate-forming protein
MIATAVQEQVDVIGVSSLGGAHLSLGTLLLRQAEQKDLKDEFVFFIGSFFSLYWGSWGAMLGAERLGATAFPFGAGVPGRTDRAIEWMATVKPKAH